MNSDFGGIRDLHHIFFTSRSLKESELWLIDKLRARYYMELGYLVSERRWGSFVRLGGVSVEPVEVAILEPGEDPSPLQRFVERHGYRWHSIALFADDVGEVASRMAKADVRMVGQGKFLSAAEAARGFFTHPRDTYVALQFVPTGLQIAPAGPDGKASGLGAQPDSAAFDGPNELGIEELAWLTVIPRDRAAAVSFYTEILGGEIMSSTRDHGLGSEKTMVRVGQIAIELVDPIDDQARDVLHTVTFRVRDLENLRSRLDADNVQIIAADESKVVVAPRFAPEVRFAFIESRPD